MIATTAEIADMEIFFKGQNLSKNFKLNTATTFHDLPSFIQRTLENVKNPAVSDCVIGPRWDDLIAIRKLLSV